jgi:hypothetical protein
MPIRTPDNKQEGSNRTKRARWSAATARRASAVRRAATEPKASSLERSDSPKGKRRQARSNPSIGTIFEKLPRNLHPPDARPCPFEPPTINNRVRTKLEQLEIENFDRVLRISAGNIIFLRKTTGILDDRRGTRGFRLISSNKSSFQPQH